MTTPELITLGFGVLVVAVAAYRWRRIGRRWDIRK